MLTELPNYEMPKKKSARTTAKAYPADTSLSVAAFGLTRFFEASSADRGGLLEAFVVQQLRAHVSWSQVGAALYHWRSYKHSRPVEVDIVLKDQQGRLVGVEIKSSPPSSGEGFTGLRELQSLHPESFYRGFMIAPGAPITRVNENLWTIPLNALKSIDVWQQSTGRIPAFRGQ